MFLILFMQALFAATFPIGKEALNYAPPCILTGMRFIIAGVLLLVWTVVTATTKVGSSTRHGGASSWRSYLLSMRTQLPLWSLTTLCYVYLSYVPEFWALRHLTALKTNLLWSSLPFITALLEFFITRQLLSPTQWLGIAIGTLGTMPIIFSCNTDISVFTSISCVGLPELALLVAVVATGLAWFLIKELMGLGYSILWINGCTMLVGGMASFATGLIFETLPATGSDWLWATVGASALVILSNLIAYTIYGNLLNHYSITFLSFSGFLCPIFGALFCNIFLGEQIPGIYVLSFIVICFGLYLFYKEELVRGVRSV